MSYVTYGEFVRYTGSGMSEQEFEQYAFEAERYADINTTGIDNVRKLRVAFPSDEYAAESVKRCVSAMIVKLKQIDDLQTAKTAAGAGKGIITSASSGTESVSYAAGGTALDAAAADNGAKDRLMRDTVRQYLSGVADSNGVNLLYMGGYPDV